MEKMSRYDVDMLHTLRGTAKRIAVRIKGLSFLGKDGMSVVAHLQKYTSGCEACRNHEYVATQLFKRNIPSLPRWL